ncbi:CsbD family protein [Methylobacterium sp. NEAU K]|uniref:CsbD family protein n=1 Tax=Methylobacterium sp. NEAU K TaxID=3064946 RepID=UPI0027341894|nr:CsbD family protein [Methylobacterium sp. NEAU K]MDP4006236.1 CsbD family protein [Methylobacterium sp. NEAU K]
MNRDQLHGASRHLKGRAQTTLGGITGDPGRQVRGAVNQVAGGAQYAYGRARDRAEDLVEDGRHLAHAAHERADDLIEDGRHLAREARRRGEAYGRRAVRYADGNRTRTLLGLAALAFAAGWLTRRPR